MNETPLEPTTRRSLLLRIAFIPVVELINFAINLFGFAMTSRQLLSAVERLGSQRE